VKNIFNDQKLYVQKVLNALDPTTNHIALIVYSSRYRHVKLHGFKDEQTRKSISNLANRKFQALCLVEVNLFAHLIYYSSSKVT
jgi:hypothetical protein